MLNNLDSRSGRCNGPAGPYGYFEVFLSYYGCVFNSPRPNPHGCVPRWPPTSQWGVESQAASHMDPSWTELGAHLESCLGYHVPDSHDTEGLTVTSNYFVRGISLLSDVIGN